MFWLILGLIVFFGIHLIPVTPIKNSLLAKLGEKKYRGVFSLISLAGLMLIIFGYRDMDYLSLWNPPENSREIAFLAMPIILILIVAGNLKCNINRFIKHPFLTGISLWGLTHLLANGDLSSSLIFSSFVIYSVCHILFSPRKPSVVKTFSLKRDALVIGIGIVFYAILVYFHQYISGVPLIA